MANTITPKPAGEYKVGTTVFDVTDSGRVEKLGPDASKIPRKVSVRLYYPVLLQTMPTTV